MESNVGVNKKRPHGRMGPFLNNRNTIWEESIKGGEMPPPVQALKGGEITPDF